MTIALEHERRVNPHQRAIENMTSWFGRPTTVYVALAISIGWIALNVLGNRIGVRPWDKPPFTTLQSVWSLCALMLTIIVLITQNRQAKLDKIHSQLALQLSLLSDHKTAKIIALLEELRRDMPQVPNRVDTEADALKQVVGAEAMAEDLEKRMNEGVATANQTQGG